MRVRILPEVPDAAIVQWTGRQPPALEIEVRSLVAVRPVGVTEAHLVHTQEAGVQLPHRPPRNTLPSFKGQDTRLRIREWGFESLRERHADVAEKEQAPENHARPVPVRGPGVATEGQELRCGVPRSVTADGLQKHRNRQ